MPKAIDKELERIEKEGKAAKAIYVGPKFELEFENEQMEGHSADVIAEGSAQTYVPTTPKMPREYKGIPLILVEVRKYLSVRLRIRRSCSFYGAGIIRSEVLTR
jgi:hypothetical protein